MEYLVVMEVSQKQGYIFKSNRLAENIGASILIRDITEELPEQIVKKLAEERQEKAGLVLRGGGKSIYAFSTEACAKEFTKRVSQSVLEQYPGVELFMATHAYSESEESVVAAINELYGKLEQKKSKRESSFRLFDLGITKQCQSTQLPAVAVNDRGLPVSAESKAKLEAAKKYQKEMFSQMLPEAEGKAIVLQISLQN